MFQFFFNYPLAVYRKGTLVLASGWPVWVLGVLALAAAALVAWLMMGKSFPRPRMLALGALQWAALALMLALLWQPALSVATLKPQQNVVAVVVDASSSMALENRIGEAKALLDGGLLSRLRAKFPVRLYQGGRTLARVDQVPAKADQPVTQLREILTAATAESATLPVGAILLLSDGADNAGGLDSDTMETLRRARIPIHTVGFGTDTISNDVEISDALLPARALPDARLSATVTLRQAGFAGKPARITVKDGDKTLASRTVKLPDDGQSLREVVEFQAGPAGARPLRIAVEPLDGEANAANNALTRLVHVEDRKPRILYIEGEPRWELKFIRRAAELDKNLELASILRTTENKFYRQGIGDPKELEHGFPDSIEELFRYQGIIIGNVEASYFDVRQQALLKEFVDRRGGGVLFLGGRAALSDGGWNSAGLTDMLPLVLPDRKGAFHRDPATVELTAGGRDSLLARIESDPQKNAARWLSLPYLADYQEAGTPKPGALVLAELKSGAGKRSPFLVTHNYGRGRVAVLASGGTWRWQMAQDHRDMSHEIFWQQLLRWLAGETGGRVSAASSRTVFEDDPRIPLRAEVRDMNYLPASDAVVTARVMGPEGVADEVTLRPVDNSPGSYAAEWKADKPGSYLVETTARQGGTDLGRDVLTFRREDGVAENFRTEQNRDLLERISAQTGGRYWRPSQASALAAEIEYSDAGISIKETRAIWNAPAAFLLLAALKAAEWLLRRKWGAV
ncbi:MAG: hypothetical protein HY858_01775 [Candidatus Solibacter usitatus]|nr:hypothetical protein [Candidatus Solibacter usitatus]